MSSLVWFRRDLRRADHPALLAAIEAGPATAVFVIEPGLWRRAGDVRRWWLAASLDALDARLGGRLVLLHGDPRDRIPDLARRVRARSVHVTRETTPHGRLRDAAVAASLQGAGVEWVETGTPYAVGPGRVRTGAGRPYQVFTPFSTAWRAHGWPLPATDPGEVDLRPARGDEEGRRALQSALREPPRLVDPLTGEFRETVGGGRPWPEPGEGAALERWRLFTDGALAAYSQERDLPATDGSSLLSPWLKVGAVHPRTLLADVGTARAPGPQAFVTELAWREFYADVLWHHPTSGWEDLRPQLAAMAYDEPGDLVEAWREGRTGYPFVDAGMRQLLRSGWMHNRVRMVTASFLVKHLHAWWPVGARHFLDHLLDGDLASNSHGWQWVAGTGTDAAPYFRVFNPVTQGERFDPEGSYVRRWVPELRHLPGAAAHRPWAHPDGLAHGYPDRVVDHADARAEALARYRAARSTG